MKKPIYYIAVIFLTVGYVGYYGGFFDITDVVVVILYMALVFPPLIILFSLKPGTKERELKKSSISAKIILIVIFLLIALASFVAAVEQTGTPFFHIGLVSSILYLYAYYSLVDDIRWRGRYRIENLAAVHVMGVIFGIFALSFEIAYTNLLMVATENWGDEPEKIIAIFIIGVLPILLILRFIWHVIENEPGIREKKNDGPAEI